MESLGKEILTIRAPIRYGTIRKNTACDSIFSLLVLYLSHATADADALPNVTVKWRIS